MDQDDRDDTMLEERLAGRSVVAIAKQYRCTTSDVDALIDRRLNYNLNNEMRLRCIKLDCERLEALMLPFFERATKDRDVAAGTLCCKLLERRALLLGLDQPTQSRLDVYQIPPRDAVSSHEKIRRTIMEFMERQPPAEREAHNLIGKIGGERALELLKAGSGNGDGAAPSDVPPDRNGSPPAGS
jgi:hypothetical protein